MTPKTTDQSIRFSQWMATIPATLYINEGGTKLQILINNYFRIKIMNTRHLRPWYANQKMSVDDSRQKLGRNMYIQGTDMH